MSFNPTRLQNQQQARRNPSPPPPTGGGRTHATIMAGRGYARDAVGPRTSTKTGFFELAFESKDFTVRRETLNPGSSIGYGINEKADRFVLVDQGLLFAFVEDEAGNVVTERLTRGSVLRGPRGKKHGYATSTERTEVFVIESHNFQKTWKTLQEGNETAAAVPHDSGMAPVPPRNRALDAITHQQAVQESARRGIKRAEQGARPAPSVGTNAIGVNLRPSGPPSE